MRIECHAFIKMSNILVEESYLVRFTNASCRLTFDYEVSVEVSTVSVEFQLGGEGLGLKTLVLGSWLEQGY